MNNVTDNTAFQLVRTVARTKSRYWRPTSPINDRGSPPAALGDITNLLTEVDAPRIEADTSR